MTKLVVPPMPWREDDLEHMDALRATYNFHNAETMDLARKVLARHKEARNG